MQTLSSEHSYGLGCSSWLEECRGTTSLEIPLQKRQNQRCCLARSHVERSEAVPAAYLGPSSVCGQPQRPPRVWTVWGKRRIWLSTHISTFTKPSTSYPSATCTMPNACHLVCKNLEFYLPVFPCCASANNTRRHCHRWCQQPKAASGASLGWRIEAGIICADMAFGHLQVWRISGRTYLAPFDYSGWPPCHAPH